MLSCLHQLRYQHTGAILFFDFFVSHCVFVFAFRDDIDRCPKIDLFVIVRHAQQQCTNGKKSARFLSQH